MALQKLMRLLLGSNPTVFEWLSSPIVYRESESFGAVREIVAKCFSPKSSSFHYVGMARGEWKRISRDDAASIKMYLYAIRALWRRVGLLDRGRDREANTEIPCAAFFEKGSLGRARRGVYANREGLLVTLPVSGRGSGDSPT